MGYVVTTVRIREDLLKEAKKRNLKLSHILEEALLEKLKKERLKRAERAAKKAAKILRNFDIDEVVKMIREDRER